MKKIIIIISLVIVGLGIITGIVLGIMYYRSFTRLFQDTNYPVSYRQKDGNMIINVKDKTKTGEVWTASLGDADFAAVEGKGKASVKKGKFKVSPVTPGMTILSLTKTVDIDGLNVDTVRIEFPIYINENEDGLTIDVLSSGTLSENFDVIGADTGYPVVLSGSRDIARTEEEYGIIGNIDFVKGRNDWTVEADSGEVLLSEYEEDGRSYIFLSLTGSEEIPDSDDTGGEGKEEDSGPVDTLAQREINTATDATEETGSHILTISSTSLGITVKEKVTFYSDGHMTFSQAEEDK
ncbi:MAG: hypothetical protein K6E28_03730 [Eubacterium sp.]|nr:hypothetical protein [Eubacterium sp.]